MKKYILLLLIAANSCLFAKQKTYGSLKASRLVSVYDGDTFNVDIDEYPNLIGKNIPIRIAGVDTPEIKSVEIPLKIKALQAKEFTKNILENAKVIELKNMRRGKYFRIVADVIVDGQNIADLLLTQGHAKPYYGRKKTQW